MGVRAALLLLLWCAATRADDARTLYDEGRAAYGRGDYAHAYERFKQAYLSSQRGELLYDMARAEEGMGKPGAAAETLRAYLRVTPETPDRDEIERRIRALEESQRLLAPAPRPRRTGLIVGVTLGVLGAVGLAVGLGVGLGTRGPGYSSADVGPLKSTP